MPELAIFAEALTPFDNDVLPLRLGTSKAQAFLFGLSAQAHWFAVREILLDPMITALIHDVMYKTHVRESLEEYVVAGEASVIKVAVSLMMNLTKRRAGND